MVFIIRNQTDPRTQLRTHQDLVLLIISGVGLLATMTWAPDLFLVSTGMLIYTAIVSPGYFAQKGQWVWVLIFSVIITISVVSILLVSGSVSG